MEEARIAYCIEHWGNGKSWEEAGAYDYMLKQVNSGRTINFEYNSMDDIYRRYRSLDHVFEEVKIEGKFKTENELNPAVFGKRSEAGVMHIGPEGEPFFGGGAHHRFAMAYVLNITFPAKIGLVHVSAIPYLDAYRKGTYKS